jgi:hypothetical protein
LKNLGTDPVGVSGWILKDDDDGRTKAIPAGTTIAPGGYYTAVVDQNPNKFGLGGADSARLFLPDGTTLVDGTSWGPSHAPHAWGRCDDGTGEFVQTTASTKNAADACPDAAAALKINEAMSEGGTPATGPSSPTSRRTTRRSFSGADELLVVRLRLLVAALSAAQEPRVGFGVAPHTPQEE